MSESTIPQPRQEFVETPFVSSLIKRALIYIKAGYPVHFRGPAGTGKTTLAMHIAKVIGRPVILTHGNSDFVPSDLVGRVHGVKQKRSMDNYIHSVKKSETSTYLNWADGCVTEAVKKGYILVYDEFTRSRPEANNILLSVLEERSLELPSVSKGDKHIEVHPDFVAIFTSNPEEYAGVYKSQDALRDRMITLDLDFFDEETEIAITQAKSGISRKNAEGVVRVVRNFRETEQYEFAPTIRSCIMIAKVLKLQGANAAKDDSFFKQVCLDVLVSETNRVELKGIKRTKINKLITDLIDNCCGPKEIFKETRKELSVETVKEISVETVKEISEETVKEISEEAPEEISIETETSNETSEEKSKETPKEKFRNFSNSEKGMVNRKGVKDNSKPEKRAADANS